MVPAMLAAGLGLAAAAGGVVSKKIEDVSKKIEDVLWLPLGDSITWGCTGPTIQVLYVLCNFKPLGTVLPFFWSSDEFLRLWLSARRVPEPQSVACR